MPRMLLMYATREGQTAKIAERIAGYLIASGVEVVCVDAADARAVENPDVEAFDCLVFGASMHAGGLEAELVRFVNGNAEAIRARPKSFFLVLLSAAAKDPALRSKWLADARRKMEQQLLVEFDEVEMFAGALRYSKYPLPLKWVMRRIAAQAGGDTDTSCDYEYTDWEQVECYAKRLATST